MLISAAEGERDTALIMVWDTESLTSAKDSYFGLCLFSELTTLGLISLKALLPETINGLNDLVSIIFYFRQHAG